MSRYAKASISGGSRKRRGLIGMAFLCLFGLTAFLGSGASSAVAAPECPNAVFRTGPSANLPDCRAYELVSPAETGGKRPSVAEFGNAYNAFDSQLISPAADSVMFQTVAGALPGTNGTGYNDRYAAHRTSGGWVTDLIGPEPSQTVGPEFGGITPEHGFYFVAPISSPELDPGSLNIPTGGPPPAFLRRPDGSFDLLAHSSYQPGDELTCRANSIASTSTAFQWLRNAAPIAGATSATYTVSAADQGAVVQCQVTVLNVEVGETKTVNPGAFVEPVSAPLPPFLFSSISPPTGGTLAVGGEGDVLSCDPEASKWVGSPSFGYRWYRNGVPIAGAEASTYTTTAADLATATTFQCGVVATNAGGSAIAVSGSRKTSPEPGFPPSPLPTAPVSVDPSATGLYISPNGDHVVFQNGVGARQLQADAPQSGFGAVYDRTPDGAIHTVSLLPGNLPASVNSEFQGISADGSTVLFSSGGALYARLDYEETVQVASGDLTAAGVSADGRYAFYADAASGGSRQIQAPADLFSFDTVTDATTQITSVGDARFVNVSADGSDVYFVSPSQIGGEGLAGQPNLYVWDRGTGATALIGTLDAADVGTSNHESSLIKWTSDAVTPDKALVAGPAWDPSRTTPDGSVIVFESAAKLTAYENAGHTEIYRYQVGAAGPSCVSCGPGAGPASADASLESVVRQLDLTHPLLPFEPTANLSADGQSVFFQSDQALLNGDNDGVQDVYEWKGGQLALISSGHSADDNFLYAVTANGSDVVILTPDHLLPQDRSQNDALYDARVNGGFPFSAAASESCGGDACQGQPSLAPELPGAASATFAGKGNAKVQRRHRRHRRHHRHHKPRHHRTAHSHRGGSK